jgi:hypothetical protein
MEARIVRRAQGYKCTWSVTGAEDLNIPHVTRGTVTIAPDHVMAVWLDGQLDRCEITGWETSATAGRYHGWTWHAASEVPGAFRDLVEAGTDR